MHARNMETSLENGVGCFHCMEARKFASDRVVVDDRRRLLAVSASSQSLRRESEDIRLRARPAADEDAFE